MREVPSSGGERHAGLSVPYSLRHLPIIERLEDRQICASICKLSCNISSALAYNNKRIHRLSIKS